MKTNNNTHIFTLRLGVTIGIIVSLTVLLFSFLQDVNYAPLLFKMISQVYPGCSNKTLFNRLICALFGFIDGFIGGCIIALLYNNININY